MLEIEGALFDPGEIRVSELAYTRAEAMQARLKRPGREGVYVHTSILLKLHATGQWGNIVREDRTVNRVNIARGSGRVLSVIGDKLPFVIMTMLDPAGNRTLICVPEEA